ncbi:NEDD8-activating enzyme E1 regulatory subunit [Umbelopsis sp. AD052]|nr:NEDD8-activating enzyme E1 regulatory subunit [Umbelopsis sp. AD052]
MTAIPDLKAQKYDRQLRLWAASGQAALENANVCLLNATTTGTEILKNLILPGIGSFSIADNAIVDQKDVSSNFFLDTSCIGKSKSLAIVEYLRELNEDVKGHHDERSPEYLIVEEPSFFDQFTMIIATSLSDTLALKLASICEAANTPLFLVKCLGFTGMFRIQAGENTIIETHPENFSDLRLDMPFPAFLDYVKEFDFDKMDSSEHGHVPFLVVLQHYLQVWKAAHDGKLPASYSERNEFKELLKKDMRSYDEENFEEAISHVWRLASTSGVPSELKSILDDPSCENITKDSTNFWIIARAIRDFVQNEGSGLLPLPGKLPDMKADTKGYVRLQQIYRQKAIEDYEAVHSRVQGLLTSVELLSDAIDSREIEEFCKFASHVKVIRYRRLEQEYLTEPNTTTICQWLEESDPQNNIVHYVIFRAADLFVKEHGSLKGRDEEETVQLLEDCTTNVLTSIGIPNNKAVALTTDRLKPYIINFARYNGAELPNIASLMGGLVAQEVIKIITRQYIPVNNTCIYDGMNATTATYVL